MKIAILSKGPGNYSTKRLKQVAIERGHEVRVVDYAKCYISVEQDKPRVRYEGEDISDIDVILLAAAITGFANPYYVWGDVGWYLSFLAFFGVLIIAPLITSRFFKKKKPPIIGQVAIESFSAQIMVLPYIMYIFGRVSVIGFLSNIIVVPMVPYAMFFSVFAGIAGMVTPTIAGWVAIPARIVLDVMLWLSAWFAQWPITQANVGISIVNLLIFYAIIIVFVLALKKRFSSVKIRSNN